MKRTLHLLGGTRTGEVEVDDDDCAHCRFVRDHVKGSVGSITFVCEGEGDINVRRVEVVGKYFGVVGLLCRGVTAEAAYDELRSVLIGPQKPSNEPPAKATN